jgi:Uma2 family endonuclease
MAATHTPPRSRPAGTRKPVAPTCPSPRRFTVAEYYKMARAGILRPDERVELLDGEIFTMAPIGSGHAATVAYLSRWFDRRVEDRAVVWTQSPVRLDTGAQPEPDIALLRFRPDLYAGALPGVDDVLLLIEVADTSFPFDRTKKLAAYARAGIPEVWLFNLRRTQTHVFHNPQGATYREHTVLGRAGRLAPAAFPDLALDLAELFDTLKP